MSETIFESKKGIEQQEKGTTEVSPERLSFIKKLGFTDISSWEEMGMALLDQNSSLPPERREELKGWAKVKFEELDSYSSAPSIVDSEKNIFCESLLALRDEGESDLRREFIKKAGYIGSPTWEELGVGSVDYCNGLSTGDKDKFRDQLKQQYAAAENEAGKAKISERVLAIRDFGIQRFDVSDETIEEYREWYRVRARELGLAENSTPRQIKAAQDANRRKEVRRQYGLSEDAPESDVIKASVDADRRQQAVKYGLPETATQDEIVEAIKLSLEKDSGI